MDFSPNVAAYIAAALVDADGNVTIETLLKTNSNATASNSTGGFVGKGDPKAYIDQNTINTAYIADNVQLIAGGDLIIKSVSDHRSTVSSSAKAGGFVGLANATSDTDASYSNKIWIDQNADLLVSGAVNIQADTKTDFDSISYASGKGFGGDAASHNYIDFTQALTQVEFKTGALVTANTLSAQATVSKLKLHVGGSAYGAGFYSEGSDDSGIAIDAQNKVILAASAMLTGLDGVDLIASFDHVDTYAKSFSRSTGLFGWVSSTASNTTGLNTTVTGAADALVVAGPRINTDTPLKTDAQSSHLAFLVSTDNGSSISAMRDASTSKRSLASGGSHGSVTFTDDQTIDFSSDVRILSGRSPVLVINSSGVITTAVNTSVNDGGTTKTSGQISAAEIFVDDISNPGAGDIVFRADDSIAGGGGLWEFGDSLAQVQISNASDKNLIINNINVFSSRQPVVWLQPSTASRTLTFHIDRNVWPGLVKIFNTGTGDIKLNGTIENPIGTTSIVNTQGSVLSTDDRDGTHTNYGVDRQSLVRTNVLCIEANAAGESVGTSGARINVDIIDAADLPDATAFETRRVNDASNTIFLGYRNQFFQGQQVQYHLVSGTALDGLEDGGYYYVIASPDGLSLKLALTAAGTAIDIGQPAAGALSDDHSLTPVTRFNVEAGDDIFLDVLGRQRGLSDDYLVTIDAVAAGGDVNILMQSSIRQSTVGAKGGVEVKHPGDANGTARRIHTTPTSGPAESRARRMRAPTPPAARRSTAPTTSVASIRPTASPRCPA